MTSIKLLDENTIQKIAAGEVIERPASVVKELLENSIDAGARNITIEIKNGGKTYIRVTDDGSGIREDEIELAFMRHSTSKLSRPEDLFNIHSLGFRGEALASISTISKVTLMTKTDDVLGGVEAFIEEGKLINKNIVGCPRGTTFIVEDLFYNVPVRKEFLKSDLTESNRITSLVYKIALGNPQVSIKYIRDNKIELNTTANHKLIDHIYNVLGRDISSNLYEVNYEKDFNIKGFISNNNLYRGNRTNQYLYINGRYIDNRDISRAIEEEYKSVIPLNRFPVYILFIEIDPNLIDVNVHPTKQEIKFSNQQFLIEEISKTIAQGLSRNVEVASFEISRKKEKKEEIPNLYDLFSIEKEERKEEIDYPKDDLVVVKDLSSDLSYKEDEVKTIREAREDHNYSMDTRLEVEDEPSIKLPQLEENLENLSYIGSIFNTYILAEDRFKSIFYIIDQHAAHERVMYEKYLNEFKREKIVTQAILTPEIIELRADEMKIFEDNIGIFHDLGIDVESFGESSLIIRGIPLIFGRPRLKNVFFDVFDNIDSNIVSNYELNIEKIMKISCVNAVKSGDNLKDEEVYSLFNQLKQCKYPLSCPHGRPTLLKMTKNKIEKEFLRIM